MTRTSLLAGASALAISALTALPAAAQCVQTGPVVTCAADDLDGFASADDNLDITVEREALVTNSDDAFDLDGTDTQTVTNNGIIDSTGDRGIDVDNGDGLTVTNDGEIIAKDDAIRGGDNVTVVNGFNGVLSSLDQEGIDAGDDLDVTNDGLIDAGDEGIQAGLRAKIANTADGAIFAFDDAIQIQGDADIENAGFVLSFEEDGIDVDSGKIVNTSTGTIASAAVGAAGIDVDAIPADDIPDLATLDLLIDNEGVIIGETGILVDAANMQAQTIRNAGEIVGFEGIAADLGAGDDIVNLVGAGLFGGSVLFGDGDDILNLSQVGPGVAGGDVAFFDGGNEKNADLIAFGSEVNLSDVQVFDDRDPARARLAFSGASGNATVHFTGFELFAFGDGVVSAADISAVAPVPAPAGFGLLLFAAGALGMMGRRRS